MSKNLLRRTYTAIRRKVVDPILYSARPSICRDVADWAKNAGIPVYRIHDGVSRFAYSHKAFPFDQPRESELPDMNRPQSLLCVPKGVVRDDVGFVILPDGQFCLQCNWLPRLLTSHLAYKRRVARRRRSLRGDYFSLLGLWSREYYHWFHDTLPRLSTALPFLPPRTRFLIHANPREYQVESLSVLGISGEMLEEQPSGIDTRVERLWFATPLGNTIHTDPTILLHLATRMRAAFSAEPIDPLRRIYLSREKRGVRTVVNEAEVLAQLRARGFEVIFPEDLCFRDQIRLYSSANVLVGPHGAALLNMIYMQIPSRVLEIAQPRDLRPWFCNMAQQLGHMYDCHLANAADNSELDSNMTVDSEGFLQQIDDICRNPLADRCSSHNGLS